MQQSAAERKPQLGTRNAARRRMSKDEKQVRTTKRHFLDFGKSNNRNNVTRVFVLSKKKRVETCGDRGDCLYLRLGTHLAGQPLPRIWPAIKRRLQAVAATFRPKTHGESKSQLSSTRLQQIVRLLSTKTELYFSVLDAVAVSMTN